MIHKLDSSRFLAATFVVFSVPTPAAYPSGWAAGV